MGDIGPVRRRLEILPTTTPVLPAPTVTASLSGHDVTADPATIDLSEIVDEPQLICEASPCGPGPTCGRPATWILVFCCGNTGLVCTACLTRLNSKWSDPTRQRVCGTCLTSYQPPRRWIQRIEPL